MDNDLLQLRLGQIFLEFQQPAGHFLEGGLVGDIVAEETRVRAAVVQSRDTPEPFLAGCVPDLEADDRVGGCVEDAFRYEGGADGRGDGCRGEGVFDVPVDEGGFAYSLDLLAYGL